MMLRGLGVDSPHQCSGVLAWAGKTIPGSTITVPPGACYLPPSVQELFALEIPTVVGYDHKSHLTPSQKQAIADAWGTKVGGPYPAWSGGPAPATATNFIAMPGTSANWGKAGPMPADLWASIQAAQGIAPSTAPHIAPSSLPVVTGPAAPPPGTSTALPDASSSNLWLYLALGAAALFIFGGGKF